MFKKLIELLTGAKSDGSNTGRAPLPDDIDLTLKAYELSLDPDVDPLHPAVAGWCFGLPPGIDPTEWPLDPESGYPLQHGFTLKLPDYFRVHSTDIVAVSFFGTAFDHCDGGPTTTIGLKGIIENPADEPPVDPDLRALWTQARSAHKRLHRTHDIIGCHYAVIPLTAAEFQGRPCPVPATADNPHLAQTGRPRWLEIGSAAQFLETATAQSVLWPVEEDFQYAFIGGRSEPRVDFSIPIVLRPRTSDPNAGRTPEDDDYESRFGPEYQTKEWAKNLERCHLGGTMFAQQHPPKMGPQYVEFEESFGNFNFGTGNAQLDLKTFAFNWDC